jgi:hypothetical protein
MHTIPDITKDPYQVQVRADGRFATADFTLFPQWYTPGTYYLPYVRKKPIVGNDPYEMIWYNMSGKDFERETGSISQGVGRLSSYLAHTCSDMSRELMAQIKELRVSGQYKNEELKELLFCERGMQFASISLLHAPQSYEGVLLTFTSFQRYFLETLACYDYLVEWKNMPMNVSGQPRPTAHVVGALTHEIEVAVELFDKGIPVWLVRHCSAFPLSSIVLENEVFPTLDETIELKLLPGSGVIWAGPAGAFRNRVCQSLRSSNINLGHSAYEAAPGRFVTVANQGEFVVLILIVIRCNCFSFHRCDPISGDFARGTVCRTCVDTINR